MSRPSTSICRILLALLAAASCNLLWAVNANPVTAVILSPDSSEPGQLVHFTATVIALDSGAPTGTVNFSDGTTALATGVPLNGSVATFVTSSLSIGTHDIGAHYNGDANYNGSTGQISHTVESLYANGFESFTLSINNYLAWCSISENGGPYSASQAFPQGTVVTLHGDTSSPVFVWGYWTGTYANGGNDSNKDVFVTMYADRSLLACCPFASAQNVPCN